MDGSEWGAHNYNSRKSTSRRRVPHMGVGGETAAGMMPLMDPEVVAASALAMASAPAPTSTSTLGSDAVSVPDPSSMTAPAPDSSSGVSSPPGPASAPDPVGSTASTSASAADAVLASYGGLLLGSGSGSGSGFAASVSGSGSGSGSGTGSGPNSGSGSGSGSDSDTPTSAPVGAAAQGTTHQTSAPSSIQRGDIDSTRTANGGRGFTRTAPSSSTVHWPDRPRSRSPAVPRRGSGSLAPVMDRIRRVVGKEEDEFTDVPTITRVWSDGREEGEIENSTSSAAFLVAADPKARDQMKSTRGLEHLVNVMRRYPDNAGIQENCCHMVQLLAGDDHAAQERIGKCGGVEIILRALRAHSILNVQERALAALSSLTLVEQNRLLIGNSQGIPTVVEVMKRYLTDAAGVQIEGCTLLANLAFGSPVNKKVVRECGGIETILATMRIYLGDAMVQTRACLALRNVSWGSVENRSLIGSCEGIQFLIAAMENHRNSVTVQEQAATALCNIVLGDERNQYQFDRNKGLEAIIRAMKLFQDDVVIQEHSIALIHNRVLRGGNNLTVFCKAGGVEALVDSVTACIWHDGVLEKGSLALRYLLTAEENRARVFRSGGIEKLVEALYTVSRRITRANPL